MAIERQDIEMIKLLLSSKKINIHNTNILTNKLINRIH